jgi:2-polyprenyl-3-methyl-5-hydroxy-6-metoxy-1,4-benzoquinol methylase
MPETAAFSCPVCSHAMTLGKRRWLYRCASCGHWASTLKPEIDALADRDGLNQIGITEGLDSLRRHNYSTLLRKLGEWMPLRGKRLLDVGCSSGLFLEMAAAQGIDAMGLEPDPTIVKRCVAQGKNVRQGYFPDAVDASERFDIISFNDVLEHIPDARGVVAACRELLTDEGMVLINLPNSGGIVYRVGCALDRLGMHKPLDRLWQVGFRSPHVHYFNSAGLVRIAADAGLREVGWVKLDTIHLHGLWKRLRADRSSSLPFSLLVWGAMVLGRPVLKAMPADITAHFFRKGERGSQ